MQRRRFLTSALAVTGAVLSTGIVFGQDDKPHVAVNQYTCNSIYGREKIDFWTRLDELKSVGVDGIEPSLGSAADAAHVGKRLAAHGLSMRSIYSGANLHEENAADAEILRLLELGTKAKEFGTAILVVNPAAKKAKSDAELIFQAKNFDKLGAGLKNVGVSLAFHYHTTELEFGGREFHHILCGTDPANVSLCFEEHWSYRGCGNSQVAVFDHLKLYGNRSVEVHLRQSIDNIWSEFYGDGDIDNVRLAAGLKKIPAMPHLVLEQAAENGTPQTLPAVEVFRRSVEYIRRVFG